MPPQTAAHRPAAFFFLSPQTQDVCGAPNIQRTVLRSCLFFIGGRLITTVSGLFPITGFDAWTRSWRCARCSCSGSDQLELEVLEFQSAPLVGLHGQQGAGDEIGLLLRARTGKPGVVPVNLGEDIVLFLHGVRSRLSELQSLYPVSRGESIHLRFFSPLAMYGGIWYNRRRTFSFAEGASCAFRPYSNTAKT